MTQNYQPRNFTPEQKSKLVKIIQEGINVNSEIEDLKGGLKDTVDAIAKEMEIKPAILNKAIKTAMKNNFEDQAEDLDVLEDILQTVGRK